MNKIFAGGLGWHHSGHGGYDSVKGWPTAAECTTIANHLCDKFGLDRSASIHTLHHKETDQHHLHISGELIARMQGNGIGGPIR